MNLRKMFHKWSLKRKKLILPNQNSRQKEKSFKTKAINFIIVKIKKFLSRRMNRITIHYLLSPKDTQKEQELDQYHIGKIRKCITKLE